MTVKKVEDVYQIALKEEEKLARKKSQQNKGRSLNRGKGVAHDKMQNRKGEIEKLLHIKITTFNNDLLSSLQVSHFGRKCRKHHTFILPMSCLK